MKLPSRTNALLFSLLALFALLAGSIYFVLHPLPLEKKTADAAPERYVLTEPSESVHTVTLTENGFEPAEITIRQGDKVIFNSALDKPYWPASDDHPFHTFYPEFDPKGMITPPENFEFVFDRPGRWRYHNHLAASETGIVNVLTPEEVGKAVEEEEPSLTNCVDKTGYQKQQCWDRQLELVLKRDGLEAAFDFFEKLYKTEPEVPKACHEWGHSLGKAAYGIYKDTGKLIVRPEASYCGYGYFHSFIAELVKDTGGFNSVLQFCDDVEAALNGTLDANAVAQNCYHGVGHGTTAWLLENPENWGNFQKVADQGTAICEKLFTDPFDLHNCYDGVFNELHLDLFNDQYGLSFEDFMKKNDPFWLCQEQADAHKESCYFEFVGIFWKIFDMDLLTAMKYVVTHIDNLQERGPVVVAKIAADWIQFDIVNDSNERNIEACRIIPTFLFESCIQGIANGFIQHGDPANLHERAFKFCSADYLTEEERSLCYRKFLGMLPTHYSPEQFKEACALVDEKYRTLDCTTALNAANQQ
jgi:hypothetical protein